MKFVRRTCLVFLSILSITIAAMWIRSYWRHDSVSHVTRDRWIGVETANAVGSRSGVISYHRYSHEVEPLEVRLLTASGVPVNEFRLNRNSIVPNAKYLSRWNSARFFGLFYFLLHVRTEQYPFAGRSPSTLMEAPATRTSHTVAICGPHWFVSSLFGAWPALTAYRILRRRHRKLHKCCQTCGYDLRSSGTRCPECGTEVSK